MGGLTEFVGDPGRAVECGICIFRRGALGDNNRLALLVQPFFERHGAEANVFEFQPERGVFIRIDAEWLQIYYP